MDASDTFTGLGVIDGLPVLAPPPPAPPRAPPPVQVSTSADDASAWTSLPWVLDQRKQRVVRSTFERLETMLLELKKHDVHVDVDQHAENDAMAVLRSRGCALLNKNSAIRTSKVGVKQREWREAHGQGTGDSYMANYCRQWRALKKAEREQQEGMA